MAAYDVVQFDGTPLSAGSDFDAWLDARDQYVMTGSVDSISRRSAAPLVTGTAGEGRTLTLHAANAAGSSLTAAQFRDAVKALFDPRLNAAGERILVIEGDDGSTDVQTGCYVMQWEYLSQGVDQYVVTLWSPSGIWQATSVTTSASNPATVTNAGNTIAYPTIELTTGTHVTRRACTVTGAGAGGGLIAYPVRFTLMDGKAISTSSAANPAVISLADHGWSTGNEIIIVGHDDAEINGAWTITVPNANQFTIPVDGSPGGTGAGGTAILSSEYDASLIGLTATNFAVYVEGVSVPCFVYNTGVQSHIWALIDTASDGTTATNVDILYGSGISNPLAGTLNDGGMDWTAGLLTVSRNSRWHWDDWSTVSSNPARPGVWRPALTGDHSEAADASYAITTESAGSLVISLGAAGTYDNSADSVRLFVGSKAGATDALKDLSRVTANLDGSNARAFVKKRVANSATWTTVWSTTSNTTVTTDIDIDDAVEIAIGLENHGSTADPATLTISGDTEVNLTLASQPTVVVGSATNMDLYDGAYTIGARSITFSDFIVPDGTLTIDCGARSITSSVAGPFYGDEDALAFSHPDQWLVLLPGSNTVTDGLSATDVVEHQESYS